MTVGKAARIFLCALCFCGAGALYAGGNSDFPAVQVASFDAARGTAIIQIDWKKVKEDDARQFGLYRSSGAAATEYNLITTLNSSIKTYADSGLDTFTEYHYIIGGALPQKALPQSKARTARERREDKSNIRAAIINGNLPGGPIEWRPADPAQGAAQSAAPPSLPPQTIVEQTLPDRTQSWNAAPQLESPSQWMRTDDSYESVTDTASGIIDYYPRPRQISGQTWFAGETPQDAGDITFPYHEPVGTNNFPLLQEVYTSNGIYFSLAYFSGRISELTGEKNNPILVNLLDKNAADGIATLFQHSYVRSPYQGTSLWYAVHNAFSRINAWNQNGALSGFDNITLVTITDGLDTASTDPALNPINGQAFKTAAAYRDYVKKMISGQRIAGKNVNAVSVGVRGMDTVTERDYDAALQAAASSSDNAFRVQAGRLDRALQDIAASIAIGASNYSYSVVTPPYERGTQIFIALDGVSTPAPANAYNFISGYVNVSGDSYILTDVTTGGDFIEKLSKVTIRGLRDKTGGVEWVFNFKQPLTPQKVVLYYKPDKDWRGTREFVLRQYPPSYSNRKTLVYLLVDNSASMNGQLTAVIKNAVANFIARLSGGARYSQVSAAAEPLYLSMSLLPLRQAQPAVPASKSGNGEPAWQSPPLPASIAQGGQSLSSQNLPSQGLPSSPAASSEVNMRPVPDSGDYYSPAAEPSLPRSSAVDNSSALIASSSPPPAAPVDNSATVAAASAASYLPRSGYGDYWVQTSSHENRNIAEEMAALLSSYSLKPAITESFVHGKTFYRVRVGPYSTISDANTVRDFVRKAPLGFYDSFVP